MTDKVKVKVILSYVFKKWSRIIDRYDVTFAEKVGSI